MFMTTDYDGETLASRIEDEHERARLADESDAEALAIERRECAEQDARDLAITVVYEYIDNSWLGIPNGPVRRTVTRRAA